MKRDGKWLFAVDCERVTGQPEVTFSRGLRRRCPEVGLGEMSCHGVPVLCRSPRIPFCWNQYDEEPRGLGSQVNPKTSKDLIHELRSDKLG
jgi:hypothetical protein